MRLMARVLATVIFTALGLAAAVSFGFPQTTLACHGKLTKENVEGVETIQTPVGLGLRAMRPQWIIRQLMPNNRGWIQLSSVSASELIVRTYIQSDAGFDLINAGSDNSVMKVDVNLAMSTIDGSIFIRGRRPNGGFTFDGVCRPADVLF